MGRDAVEIVIGWEESFGISISDAEATVLRTPRQSVELIASRLSAQDQSPRPCLTLRAFYRLRRSIASATGISRHRIRPNTRVGDVTSIGRGRTWPAVRAHCGISTLPGPGWLSPWTVGDLARWAVIHAAKELKPLHELWTRSEIRTVVRAVISDVTGVKHFEDDDDFIRDIGID
jgi:acyl carrier protein